MDLHADLGEEREDRKIKKEARLSRHAVPTALDTQSYNNLTAQCVLEVYYTNGVTPQIKTSVS